MLIEVTTQQINETFTPLFDIALKGAGIQAHVKVNEAVRILTTPVKEKPEKPIKPKKEVKKK